MQALRIDGQAGLMLEPKDLAGLAGLGSTLRQLAILNTRRMPKRTWDGIMNRLTNLQASSSSYDVPQLFTRHVTQRVWVWCAQACCRRSDGSNGDHLEYGLLFALCVSADERPPCVVQDLAVCYRSHACYVTDEDYYGHSDSDDDEEDSPNLLHLLTTAADHCPKLQMVALDGQYGPYNHDRC